ncbi:MAG: aminoglycoside phosphotransferase family protein [Oscillospiraceae bacterium]|nr:aminoglycoside phosphotransferase family protein [Oscillospiraceae bacterium]
MKTADVLQAFGITAPCTACTPVTEGHMHLTWYIETADGSYVLQELRHAEPAALMDNITMLTAHVRDRRDVHIPHFYPAADGLLHEGRYRLMNRIPGEPVTAAASPAQIEAAGFAFGRFDAALHGLEGLREVYPGLHNTIAYRDRLRSLRLPVQYTQLHRKAATLGEAACSLWEQQRSGLLPLRNVHGDTKGSNVLVHGTDAAVIDLDTAGKGLAAYDYGDGIRSLAQRAGVLDRERFRAFTRGFLRGMPLLSEEEIRSLVPGICCITTELAMRYLIDIAEGCRYFGKAPEQAAARAGELLAFAFEILAQEQMLQGELQQLRSRE